jgi:putative two-component system response regulator
LIKANKCVLIVDDEKMVRRLIREKLSPEGYLCIEAENAEQVMEKMLENEIALVLLDIKMPGRSGVDLLPELRNNYPDTMVIMATASSDIQTAIQCMKNGAYDYFTKPFTLDELSLSVMRALEKRTLELELRNYRQHLEQMVARKTEELEQALDGIKIASLDTIYRLARAAEYKDGGTGAHIKRIGRYCACITRQMGLSSEKIENIIYAAPMHDIGKIGIPDRLLLKPGKLDTDEWEIMKRHTIMGSEILHSSDVEFIKLAEVIALTHHEKWEGSGYPEGLKGESIPLAGRIVAIADVFDALTSKRPYKEAYSVEESLSIIRKSSGTHFDPNIVDAFFDVSQEIIDIRQDSIGNKAKTV